LPTAHHFDAAATVGPGDVRPPCSRFSPAVTIHSVSSRHMRVLSVHSTPHMSNQLSVIFSPSAYRITDFRPSFSMACLALGPRISSGKEFLRRGDIYDYSQHANPSYARDCHLLYRRCVKTTVLAGSWKYKCYTWASIAGDGGNQSPRICS